MMNNDEFFNYSSIEDTRESLISMNKSIVNDIIISEFDFNKIIKLIDNVIDYLILDIKLLLKNGIHIELARIKLMTLQNYKFITDSQIKYKQGILVIMNVLELYDVVERTDKNKKNNNGVYYHYLNYSYYVYNIVECKNDFLLPILFDISATNIIKVRTKHLYFCGICTSIKYVDEFYQTPLEFFIHDINHSRRMIEKNVIHTDLDKK